MSGIQDNVNIESSEGLEVSDIPILTKKSLYIIINNKKVYLTDLRYSKPL